MKEKVSNKELFEIITKQFEYIKSNFATSKSLKRFATKTDLEDLAAMVARGFEKTATKDELNGKLDSFREEVKKDINEFRSDLTQTIFKEVGRLDRRLDQMALRSELQQVEKRVTRLERKTA